MTTTPDPETFTAECYYCGCTLTANEATSTDSELEAVERESCDACHAYYREPDIGHSDTWAEWRGER